MKYKICLIIIILLFLIPTASADNDTLQVGDLNPMGVDYYFNNSCDTDGVGSADNPYNKLTPDRLRSDSTIHLANGEYNLTTGKTLNNVEIIGEDCEKTIIRYTGSGIGKFSLNIDNYLSFKNITLIGFNIDVEGATLIAENTIFKNSVASATISSQSNIVNSASNSFGGAIYAYSYQNSYNKYYPTVNLNNSTFLNCTGEYGGAICMNEGSILITNSTFKNNHAYNFGGAIAAIYSVSLRIQNSIFSNDYSANDAGGAIYLYKSTLSATNLSIFNSTATFGAAIASVNSTLALLNFNAFNNTALYEGGAIYQIYNGASVKNSNFKNNTARNGGAIYLDAVKILTLSHNNFTNNNALRDGSGVYLMFSPDSLENISNNFINNDFYFQKSLILNIGDGNYTLLVNNFTNITLPDYYDLRLLGFTTPIRDQQSGGNCWAFSAIAALESAILKASNVSIDLSEENLKNIMQLYSDYGWSGIETNNGGFDEMSIAYLTSWLGPVSEEIEKYDDYSMLSPVLKSLYHIQNIIFLGRDSYIDNDKIKEAIVKYGAVSTGIYYDSAYFSALRNSYYYYGSASANHAVAIVGWDDNYSSNYFNYKPAGNGAWIVKNSWGEDWGDGGYFYVSYYDTKFAEVGVSDYSYAFVFNDTQRYDKNYQYDIIGRTDYLINDAKSIWVENIFNATDSELLAAVSTYFRKDTDWELFIYLNDELVSTKNGSAHPSYQTIPLDNYIPITAGDIFKVVFKLTCDNNVEFAISEKISANQLSYRPNISFFSFDGDNWIDLYNYTNETESDGGHYYTSQVASIKAFTILYELKPEIKLNISNLYNDLNVTAVVYDQYNNLIRSGSVIFEIEGVNTTVDILNSKSQINHTFADTGVYNINAYYLNAISNKTVNITRLNIKLSATVSVFKNNVTIDFTSQRIVNTTLVINNTHNINLVNGKSTFNLYNLDYGYYDVDVNVTDSVFAGNLKTNFNITIIKTKIIASDVITYYNREFNYSIYLTDINNKAIANHMISAIINGKSYAALTDDDGLAVIPLKFSEVNTFKATLLFFEDQSFFSSSQTVNIDVKSTINFKSADYYIKDSKYSVELLDLNGNPLAFNQINVNVNGIDKWLITNSTGHISDILNLNSGSYLMSVKNIESNETLSKIINVVLPIMENKDISMYYGDNTYYTFKIFGAESGDVKISIAGKTYFEKAEANSYIYFKITNLPNTYVVTAEFNGFSVSNKIIVKNILSAKNISKKKSKVVKFKAKLLVNYKYKKLTFKIKNKTYKAKTNKKGIATLSLKNLKKGKYTIFTYYGKVSIKNIIKIK